MKLDVAMISTKTAFGLAGFGSWTSNNSDTGHIILLPYNTQGLTCIYGVSQTRPRPLGTCQISESEGDLAKKMKIFEPSNEAKSQQKAYTILLWQAYSFPRTSFRFSALEACLRDVGDLEQIGGGGASHLVAWTCDMAFLPLGYFVRRALCELIYAGDSEHHPMVSVMEEGPAARYLAESSCIHPLSLVHFILIHILKHDALCTVHCEQ